MRTRLNRLHGYVDCHTHCGGIDANNFYNMRYPCTQDISILQNTINQNSVEYAVTFPMPSSLFYNTKTYWLNREFVPSGIEDVPFCIENEYLLSEIDFFGFNNILPFVSISLREKTADQCRFIRDLMKRFNIYGLKHHTKADQIGLVDYETNGKPFIELAEEFSLPIMIHTERTGISSPMEIFSIALKHPTVRFCLAHYAGFSNQFFHELAEYTKSYKNIFFDSAPTLFTIDNILFSDEILDIDYSSPIDVVGYFLLNFNDCFLWGTDSPWLCAAQLNTPIKRVYSYQEEIKLRKAAEAKYSVFSTTAIDRYLFGNT